MLSKIILLPFNVTELPVANPLTTPTKEKALEEAEELIASVLIAPAEVFKLTKPPVAAPELAVPSAPEAKEVAEELMAFVLIAPTASKLTKPPVAVPEKPAPKA